MASTIKVIQLNLWKGKFFDQAIAFLKQENPDIITLQEVSTGKENLYADNTIDLFDALKERLRYRGVFAPMHHLLNDPQAREGNAILTKGTVVSHEVLWLKPYEAVPPHDERDHPASPRNALDCLVEWQGQRFHVISTHGAWTREPKDTPEKIRQATLLANYIQKLGHEPFILGGDLNMPPESEVEKIVSAIARNAVTNPPSKITSTLHPTIHKTSSFKPDGLIVDYLFTSPHFTVQSIDAPVVTVSDHLPVRATLAFTL